MELRVKPPTFQSIRDCTPQLGIRSYWELSRSIRREKGSIGGGA
jgi:hypothetical protein